MRSATACWLPEALLPQEAHASNGFAYHLTDLFLVELRRVVTAPEERPGSAALLALLEPFCQALAQSDHEPLMARLRSQVFLAVAKEVSSPSEAAPLTELSLVDFSTHLYDLGTVRGGWVRVMVVNDQHCMEVGQAIIRTPGHWGRLARPHWPRWVCG